MTVFMRPDWGAKHPPSTRQMRQPAIRTFIHHSVTPSGPDPARIVRAIEAAHMSKFGVAVGYSWLIAPTGDVYEGQGWGRVGAHTHRHNSTSHGICFLGTFTTETPSLEAVDAAVTLIRTGIELGHIAAGSPIDPHSAVKQTTCPGGKLASELPQIRVRVRHGTPPPPPPQRAMPRRKAGTMLFYKVTGRDELFSRSPDGVIAQIDAADPALIKPVTVSPTVHEGFLRVAVWYVEALKRSAT